MREQQESNSFPVFKTVAFAILGLLILSTCFGSIFFVSEGYRGVVTTNGKVTSLANPGMNFKIPFFQGVTNMSVQQQLAQYGPDETGGQAERPFMEAFTKDNQPIDITVKVNYTLNPDAVLRMYSEVGSHFEDTILTGRLQQRVKETIGQRSAADISGDREAIAKTISEGFVADMAAFGIVINSVQLANINYSPGYREAAEAAAKAQAEVVKARQELERTKVDTQKQVAEATNKAQAVKAAADGNAYSVKINADALAYSKEVNGKAEATAIHARGEALHAFPELVSLSAVDKWDGTLPTSMIPGGSVPFISVPDTH